MMCYWHVKRSLYIVGSVKHIKKWLALISINLCGFDVLLCNYAVLRKIINSNKTVRETRKARVVRIKTTQRLNDYRLKVHRLFQNP
jgi:hypothetical protein